MKFFSNWMNSKEILRRNGNALFFLLVISPNAFSLTYQLPATANIVGEYQQITAKKGSNIYEVAEDFDVGVGEMLKANPNLSHTAFKKDTLITIPSQFTLPKDSREGIVLNLANQRIFYFPKEGNQVMTYPVGIGRQGWATPVGKTEVVDKIVHPAWHPTPAIRREAEEKGITLPDVIPAGPHNPLGQFAMHLGIPGILIHGTNSPHTIGLQSSHGCIRLYADDIEELFSLTSVGTPVRIVYEPHQAD